MSTPASTMAMDSESTPFTPIEKALYSRLELTDIEIREVCLVKILPHRAPRDIIRVSVRNATPEDIGNYYCLSYECGPQDKDLLKQISEFDESQGTDDFRDIGPSLYEFLEVAQSALNGSKGKDIIDFQSEFWIDALSIDQNDIHKKAREVAKMGKIYAQASKTIVWLGHMDKPGHDWEAEYNKEGVGQFFEKFVDGRGYWRRAWIVQELALSRQPVVLMGNFALPYDKLFAMVNTNDGRGYNLSYLIRHDIRKRDSIEITWALYYLRRHKCEIAHDHIYSIRSLMEKFGAIPVDYESSHAQVIFEVFTAFPEELCWCSLRVLVDHLPVRQCPASHGTQCISPRARTQSTIRSLSPIKDTNELCRDESCMSCSATRYSNGPFIEFTLAKEQARNVRWKCDGAPSSMAFKLNLTEFHRVLDELKYSRKTFVNGEGISIRRSPFRHFMPRKLERYLIRIALWALEFEGDLPFDGFGLYIHRPSMRYEQGIEIKNDHWPFREID